MESNADELVIDMRGLVKRFGSFAALDGLDLQVTAGEVHGFLGPNGAGKSTAIRVLLGLLRATAGSVRLFGGDPWRDAVALHRRVAYVPGDVTLWPSLTGGEVIDLLGNLRGGLDPGRRQELIDAYDLDTTKRCRTYSKGNRQKVALVAALATDAPLLILDEPTSGLDPLMESLFRSHVVAARDAGRSVLLSSHILSEVEALCSRVSIIRAGRIVETGTLRDLRHLRRSIVTVEAAGTLHSLGEITGVYGLDLHQNRATCTVDQAAMPTLLAWLASRDVQYFEVMPPTLEDLFLHHYEIQPATAGTDEQ